MAVSASAHSHLVSSEKKHWWLTNKKVVERYVREAKLLMATGEHSDPVAALGMLETALAMAPRMEAVLELKARCLLHLRRFKDVANMLQDQIPSLKMAVASSEENYMSSSSGSSEDSSISREKVRLLPSSSGGDSGELLLNGKNNEQAFKCFSVSDLKKKVMAGLSKNVEKEEHWRYSVLGQACCHLGLMEDAMVLLQTGKRLALAASRRESISLPDDIVPLIKYPIPKGRDKPPPPQKPPKTEYEIVSHLLSHIKLLMRRKATAIASLDAGLYSDSIRHFSKVLDGRRGAPQAFLAECYVLRASAYKSCGRVAEAIADCNRALALETSRIDALVIRANLFETVGCLPDSLHDLEHLKLLYNTMLRDRKLPGPAWKRQNVLYREIPGKLCSLTTKIQQLKEKVITGGESGSGVDYYALIGLRRGCSRSELERAHLLLALKHKPDRSSSFVERCEFADEREMGSVRDRARASSLLLYRLIQKGYTSIMSTILDEEAREKQRKKAILAVHDQNRPCSAASIASPSPPVVVAVIADVDCERVVEDKSTVTTPPASAFQGVFCRDLAIVGSLLSQAGYSCPLPVKHEALTF